MIHRLHPNTVPLAQANRVERSKPDPEDFRNALRQPEESMNAERRHDEPTDAPILGHDETFARDTAANQPDLADRIDMQTYVAGLSVDALLLPWQLVSQGVLSHLGTSNPGNSVFNPGSNALIGTSQAAATRAQVNDGVALTPLNISTPHVPSPTLQWQNSPAATSQTYQITESGGSRPSVADMAGMASQWPERLVRWIADSGESTTAWIRDYRLNEKDIQSLVQEIVEHSRENDVPLLRIVVNGQECWRAGQASSEEFR